MVAKKMFVFFPQKVYFLSFFQQPIQSFALSTKGIANKSSAVTNYRSGKNMFCFLMELGAKSYLQGLL